MDKAFEIVAKIAMAAAGSCACQPYRDRFNAVQEAALKTCPAKRTLILGMTTEEELLDQLYWSMKKEESNG